MFNGYKMKQSIGFLLLKFIDIYYGKLITASLKEKGATKFD